MDAPTCNKCGDAHWSIRCPGKYRKAANKKAPEVTTAPAPIQEPIKIASSLQAKRPKGLGFPVTGDQFGFQSREPFSRQHNRFTREGNNEKV